MPHLSQSTTTGASRNRNRPQRWVAESVFRVRKSYWAGCQKRCTTAPFSAAQSQAGFAPATVGALFAPSPVARSKNWPNCSPADTAKVLPMPRYEYLCNACGKTFEATQRMSDPPITSCSCGVEGQVRRLMSSGNGLIFKGSGFYITDYKNSNASSAKTESKAETSSSSAAPSPAPGTCGNGGCGNC